MLALNVTHDLLGPGCFASHVAMKSVASARQSVAVARYLMKQRRSGTEKFPLLVELEPLFQCNLACSFCGKIQYSKEILKKRMPVQQAPISKPLDGLPIELRAL